MAARLLVGLGNPGREYEKTRHNAGFILLDRLAKTFRAEWKKCRYADALEAVLPRQGERETPEVLLKPQCFMNLSGEVVGAALHWWKWPQEELLVIVDDVALPVGQLRLRVKGSPGGHNGLRSIEATLGSGQYARLRVGVGAAEPGELVGHVLGKFLKEEYEIIERTSERAVEAILACRLAGYEAGAQIANQKV